jgi:hypothetical protein
MTTNYCYTGPRTISYEQGLKIEQKLAEGLGESWHVGDAAGADAVVRRYLESCGLPVKLYRAEGKQPWQLAQRSKAMVDGCAKLGNAKLIAYPNKPCPAGVKPGKNFAGKGSGTWGTIAYAKYLGLEIEICWLMPGLTEPDWLKQEQLSLW